MNDGEGAVEKALRRQIYSAADVLVVVIVHIPHLLGYFSNRLSILQLCLGSLVAHSPDPVEILVFDNASCPEVTDYLRGLQREGGIQHLHRASRNIGKLAAMMVTFNAIDRPVVAFNDDDVFFYPNWLEPQLAILNAFPRVGTVSGVPTLDGASFAVSAIAPFLEGSAADISSSDGEIQPEWEADWALSTGRSPDKRMELARTTRIPILSTAGVRAYAGATHFQYIAPARLIRRSLPQDWPSNLMGGVREIDQWLDNAGYLRLSTTNRVARHMGNYVQRDLQGEAAAMGLKPHLALNRPALTIFERLPMKSGRVRSWGRKLYRRLGLVIDGEGLQNLETRRGSVNPIGSLQDRK